MRCADAQAVLAGSPPEQKSFQVVWPLESRMTVGMRAGRGTGLDRKQKLVTFGSFCSLSVWLKTSACFLPAAFSNTPSTLSTPLSSGSRWEATSHCTLHSSVCRRVSFTQAFHFSAACFHSELASSCSAASYRT